MTSLGPLGSVRTRTGSAWVRSCLALALGILAAPSAATILPNDFSEELVASGLNSPTSMRFLPDGRILVTEQTSRNIRLLRADGTVSTSDPVLTVPDVNTSGGEQGVLSLEVDRDWPARNFVYVYYTYRSGFTDEVRLTRYVASGDLT
ncbi:MAG: hypothetical protein HKO53_19335, partial [Gemmatimonadetes bacterium]|nr:hypothetical protein [Gemmatimonadota bacterium]